MNKYKTKTLIYSREEYEMILSMCVILGYKWYLSVFTEENTIMMDDNKRVLIDDIIFPFYFCTYDDGDMFLKKNWGNTSYDYDDEYVLNNIGEFIDHIDEYDISFL